MQAVFSCYVLEVCGVAYRSDHERDRQVNNAHHAQIVRLTRSQQIQAVCAGSAMLLEWCADLNVSQQLCG